MEQSNDRTGSPPPLATYRLQLHQHFRFEDAAATVPYLARLGVSHLYLSPIFAAAAGSTHGYDVVDHNTGSPELGGMAGLLALANAAHEHGLLIIVDIVPNHVGLDGGRNPWWRDVMRHGHQSPFAGYFDIDWEGQPHLRGGVLVYPTLGAPFGVALNNGELQLSLEDTTREIVLRYYERSFPIDPRCYRDIAGVPPPGLAPPEAMGDFLDVLDRLTSTAPADAPLLLDRWCQVLASNPEIEAFIQDRVATHNGNPGDPASFDDLERLLQRQHYRLAYWRIAGDEINYRRFFDINELAAIRQEHEPVFETTHRLLRQLIESGIVSGVRVDHIDGLYNPEAYLERLRALGAGQPGFTVHVEKIILDESLPASWATDGTTGYDQLALTGLLLTDPSGEQPISGIYDEFTGGSNHLGDIELRARTMVASQSFAGEVTVLSLQLHRIAQRERVHRDHTLRSLRQAIESLLAAFPVYRTYLEHDQPRDADREVLERAMRRAMTIPGAPADALAFLCETLLLEGDHAPAEHLARIHFRRRFQQLSGPVMAKGMEDTTFFRYVRLLALNEVGAEPGHFGAPLSDIHRQLTDRARHWPHALSASTTHDTKRSEDARARLLVLPEIPTEWRREVRAWARMNARFTATDGRRLPDLNHEYAYYQSLVAAWEPGSGGQAFRDRIEQHMLKFVREAKDRTSWTMTDSDYEDHLRSFIRQSLAPVRSRRFLERVDAFVRRIDSAARVKSLSALALKVLGPGIPNLYQGTELPDHSLTDPDNRRPVDFAHRAALLDAGGSTSWPGALAVTDPAAKLTLTARLLAIRRMYPSAISGACEPIAVSGPRDHHLFAFLRTGPGEDLAVVLPVRMARHTSPSGDLLPASLDGSTIHLPPGDWRNELTGEPLAGGPVLATTAFAGGPIAIFGRKHHATP